MLLVLDRSGGFDRLGGVLVEAVFEGWTRWSGSCWRRWPARGARRPPGVHRRSSMARRRIPRQERKACWGWRREPSTLVISAPVLGPIFSAQRVEALRSPLAHASVFLGHVLVGGGVTALERGAQVAGHALAAV